MFFKLKNFKTAGSFARDVFKQSYLSFSAAIVNRYLSPNLYFIVLKPDVCILDPECDF